MSLNRETHGQGPELLLLHGWGMNLRVFDALVAALAGTLRVTTVDLPGHGRSAWDPRFDAEEAYFDALLDSLPPKTHLLGWSLGGQWAMRLAARLTARVDRLVLIATTPRFVSSEDWPCGLARTVLEQFASALQSNYGQTVADFLELQVRGSVAAAQVLARLTCALREHGDADPRALAAGLLQLRDSDLRSLASAIEASALVIAGQYDRVTPPGAAAALSELLPRARQVMIARAGHVPFLSHTDVVAQAVREFLLA